MRPHIALSSEGFDPTNARPELPRRLGGAEFQPDDVHAVPADLKLEGFVALNETILDDAATRRNQLDEIFECCRCRWVGHEKKVRRRGTKRKSVCTLSPSLLYFPGAEVIQVFGHNDSDWAERRVLLLIFHSTQQ